MSNRIRKLGMAVGDRVTEGKDGRAGVIKWTHSHGWVTVLWDDGWSGLAHASGLWYE